MLEEGESVFYRDVAPVDGPTPKHTQAPPTGLYGLVRKKTASEVWRTGKKVWEKLKGRK